MSKRFSITVAGLVALSAPACNPATATVTAEPALSAQAPVQASATSPAVTAAPAAARRSKATAAEARDLLARAEKCFPDPTCTEDADALYRSADDAGAKGVSCFRFYYGTGVAKDLVRARACFEREVAEGQACGGSSPDLDRVYLAAMLVDAQGGPADAGRAEALFADCFKDVAAQGVLDEIPRRSKPDPARAPFDFCRDHGGTTLTMGQCIRIDGDRVLFERAQVERKLYMVLDHQRTQLARRARAAWTDFASKEGDVYGDKYRGGSLSSNANVRHRNELEDQRTRAMARIQDYRITEGADLAQAERALEKAYHEACDQDAERKKLCAVARKAWAEYRDAEVALYVGMHTSPDGPEKGVARDVKTLLARSYQADLELVVKP